MKGNYYLKKQASTLLYLLIMLVFTAQHTRAMPFRGLVIDSVSHGVPSATVELCDPKNGTIIYSIQVDNSGFFGFPEVMERDYQIRITAPSYPDQWFSRWANTIYRQYTTRVDVATIPDTLFMAIFSQPQDNPPNSTLTVTLSDSTGNALLYPGGFYVAVIRRMDYFEMPGVFTATSATITFDTLQSADYFILIRGGTNYPEQFYDPDRNTAMPRSYITIKRGQQFTQAIRMVNPPAGNGVLRGICRSETDARLSGITVALCQPVDTFKVIYSQITDGQGVFSFLNIMDVNYYLKFSGNGYPGQWFSKSRNATTRYPDEMLWPMHFAGDTVPIRLSLNPIDNPAIGSVTIVVRDSTGKKLPPPGTVEFIDVVTNLSYTPGYDSLQGRFVGRDLPTGKYAIKLNFIPYPPQFYSPAGNTGSQTFMMFVNPNDSLFFDVKMVMNPGQTTTVPTYGFLKGIVRDSSGPVANAMINIVNQTQSVIQSSVTLSDGTCKALRIPTQEIIIAVQASGYPIQFWSPQGMTRSPLIANKVFISSTDTFYFDAFLVRFTDTTGSTVGPITKPPSAVHGKVYEGTTGKPLNRVRVVLLDMNQPNDVNTRNLWSPWVSYTDTTGQFSLANVPAGNYRCVAEADSQNYVAQFYLKSDLLNTAKILTIDSMSSPMMLEFSLRQGGILKGSVVTASGSAVGNARIEVRSNDNSRWFETMTAGNGTWSVSGVPRGIWHVWVNHDTYIPVDDNQKRDFEVIEGSSLSVLPFTMKAGGFLYGIFSSPVSFNDSGSGTMRRGNCYLYHDSLTTGSKTRWPDFYSGLQFEPFATTGNSGTFRSNAILPGNYRACYSPQPQSWNNPDKSANLSILSGLGYSFIGSAPSSELSQPLQIVANDSTQKLSLVLRKGFSIFGTLYNEDGSAITGNYGVEAMVKRDSVWFLVSFGSPLPGGRFELPGLVDGEEYYLAVWADGYSHQFWSQNGNSVNPETPYRFNAPGYTPLALKLSKKPSGIAPSQITGPLSLRIEGDSLGFPLLKWESDPSLPIERYTLYRYDRTDTVTTLTTISRSSNVTGGKYRDISVLTGWRDYIVVGNGAAITLRSNRNGFDPRKNNLTSANPLWLDVYADQWGVGLEWGMRNDTGFAATDSINVYKSVGTDPFKLIFRRPALQMMLHDDSWDRKDSGKTYTFYVELPSRRLTSPKVSITLDATLFAGLAKVLTVGPYEQYQRISDAVTAANDYDNIEVRPGIYSENISLKGKILSLNGSWDFGKPPVIDGGGGIAITVPVCIKGTERDRPRISGFIIRNSSTGLKSMYQVEVSECLFDNVSVAVSMAIDSTGLLQQLQSNPFKPTTIEAKVTHCTFIARKSGSLIASATSVGIAEQPGYTGPYTGVGNFYITPSVSLNSRIYLEKSNVAFYQSGALQTTLPVTLSGNSTRIEFSYSNFWQTATTVRSTGVNLMNNITTLDPQFTDSSEWFVAASSPMVGTDWNSWIGYDSRKYNNGGPIAENRPSAIRNLVAAPVGLNAIVLRWTAAQETDNVIRYRIYRLPGNPSLFYINQKSQWEPKIPEDSLFSIIDSFSTTGTSFLDSTVTLGKTYLYVVVAVNSTGNESEVSLPAPPDISTYFVNTYSTQLKLTAGKWHMIGIQGGSSAMLNTNSPHILFDWDDTRTPDKTYSQYGRGYEIKPAAGYWFKPAVDTVITMNTASLSALKTVESTIRISLKKGTTGWNLISSPFPFSISPDWLASLSAWEWNADSLGYRKATTLRPWKAYWVFAASDTALPLWKKQPLSYYQSRPLAKAAAPTTLWEVRLSLRRKSSFDTDNFIGVVPAVISKSEATSTPEPPAAFGAARLYIVDNSASTGTIKNTPDELAQLYKAPAGKKDRLEWIIGINPSDEPSELTIHNIENLPEELFAFWVEESRVINIRQQQQIPIAPKNSETFGYIIITANPADLALFSSNLVLRAPFPNPFKGAATIEYVLPYSWSKGNTRSTDLSLPVKLSIYDIQGNHITRLIDALQKPGIYRTVWNGENSRGSSVAAGMYLMKLQYGNNNRITRLYRIQ